MPDNPCLPVDALRQALKCGVTYPDWQPANDVTWCNFFTHHIARLYGVTLLSAGPAETPLMAYLMVQRMMDPGQSVFVRLIGNDKWTRARDHALAGHLVIAAAPPPPGSIHGHVNVVAPERDLVNSEKWNIDVPQCANVGGSCFYGKGLNFAFGAEPPELFLLSS